MAKDVIPNAEAGLFRYLGQGVTEVLLHPISRQAIDLLFGLLAAGRWITDPPELAMHLPVMLPHDPRYPPDSLYLEDVQVSASETRRGVRWSPSGNGRLGLARSCTGGLGMWRPSNFVRRDRLWAPVLASWSIEYFRRDTYLGQWYERTARREGTSSYWEVPTTVDQDVPHPDPRGVLPPSYYPDWMTCTPWGIDRPWLWGWWYGLIWPSMVTGPELWTQLGRMLESRAMAGMLVATTRARDEAAKVQVAEHIYKSGSMGVVALTTDEEDLRSVDTGANKGSQVVDSAVNTTLRWIEVSMLGGARLWSSTGPMAAADIEKQLLQIGVVSYLANAIAGWIQSGPGRMWAEWNGKEKCSVQWVLPWEQPQALASIGPVLDRLTSLAEKGLIDAVSIRPLVTQTLAQAGIALETTPVEATADTLPVPPDVRQQVGLGQQLARLSGLAWNDPARGMGRLLMRPSVDQTVVLSLAAWHANNPPEDGDGWNDREAPSPDWVAWLLHGGQAGADWTAEAHQERAIPAKYNGIDFTPAQDVIDAYKDGLRRHDEGETGDGIEPITIRMAQGFARGKACTPAWARKGNRWWGRNERFAEAEPGTPAYASAQVWGGRNWFAKIVRAMDAADD